MEEDEGGALVSLFLDENYVLQEVVVGEYRIPLLSLQCASTDYDLTGQILWPGTELLNTFILNHREMFKGASVIELGSGVGLTGLLCGHVSCSRVVMTDHNDTVLKMMRKNVELQTWCTETQPSISCEKLDWGNEDHLLSILKNNRQGFDLVLGADICYQQSSLPPLFSTVRALLSHQTDRPCKFILAYISRLRSTDLAFHKQTSLAGLEVHEIPGQRTCPGDGAYQGVVYEMTLAR